MPWVAVGMEWVARAGGPIARAGGDVRGERARLEGAKAGVLGRRVRVRARKDSRGELGANERLLRAHSMVGVLGRRVWVRARSSWCWARRVGSKKRAARARGLSRTKLASAHMARELFFPNLI